MDAQGTTHPTGRVRRAKARVFGLSIVDLAIDIGVPVLVSAALSALGVPAYLALTAGGVLIGGKAALGPLAQWRAGRRTSFVLFCTVLAEVALGGLALAGAPGVIAAATAGVIAAVPVAQASLGGEQVDGMGLFVLVELAAGVVVTLVSDDPRFVLARPAIYTAVAGIYALVSCRVGRPLMFDAAKPMAVAGDPLRGQAYENAWLNSARFRAISRAMTGGLAAVMVAESVLRVIIVYRGERVDLVGTGLAAQLPAIALLVVFVLGVRFLAVPRSREIVDRELNALRTVPGTRPGDPQPPANGGSTSRTAPDDGR